jgi:hypothetical protein
LIDDVYSHLTHDEISERYSAAIVIGNLCINEKQLSELSKVHEAENEEFNRLLLSYVLAKRTQEQPYLDAFVSLYPQGNKQQKIWDLQTKTGYPLGLISPLQRFLAEQAKTDDKALKKLTSGLVFADGAYAESLADQITELYSYQPDRVLKALAAWPEKIELIKALAEGRVIALDLHMESVWPERCRKIKESFSWNEDLHVMFSEKPEPAPVPTWVIEWEGVRIPVPIGQYEEMRAFRDAPGRMPAIFLKNKEGVIISAMHHSDLEPITDIFARATMEENYKPTHPEDKEFTRLLFGEPPTMDRLTTMGYRHSPADLTCQGEAWKKEMPVAIALILKNIGPQGVHAAYRNVGRHNGWLTVGKSHQGDLHQWRAWVFGNESPFSLVEVTISLPHDSPFSEVGLMIGENVVAEMENSPRWLSELGHALQKDQPEQWHQLAVSIQRTGLTEKSVESVRRLEN